MRISPYLRCSIPAASSVVLLNGLLSARVLDGAAAAAGAAIDAIPAPNSTALDVVQQGGNERAAARRGITPGIARVDALARTSASVAEESSAVVRNLAEGIRELVGRFKV